MTLSAYHIATNKIRITPVASIAAESPNVKIFTFKDKACSKAKPGQFIMLWIPRVDEIPLSVMDVGSDGDVSVAIKNVGEATACLHSNKAGELVGVRGPFGNSFSEGKGSILMVGGGTGIAPLFFLAKRLNVKKSKITFVVGAKMQKDLILKSRLESSLGAENVKATTEDGTCGTSGLCTDLLEQLLSNHKFDLIYACGPEKMLHKTFELAEKYDTAIEVSLERLMRCAIGLCGSCVIGKYRVCADGPVFNSNQLREISDEFGTAKRGLDGRKIKL